MRLAAILCLLSLPCLASAPSLACDTTTTPRAQDGAILTMSDGAYICQQSTGWTLVVAPTGTVQTTSVGNAATATKLATARAINGVAFDGTAPITLSLTGPVISTGNATAIAAGAITDTMVAGLTASKLSGVVPATNLGTGSPDSSYYLRGDGVWAPLAAAIPQVDRTTFASLPRVAATLSPLLKCNAVRRIRCSP